MRRRKRHIIAGIGWVVGSLIIWAWICDGVSLVLLYLANERRVHFAEVILMGIEAIQIGGIMIIPPVIAVLAMRSKLPGTGRTRAERRGFPIEVLGPRV